MNTTADFAPIFAAADRQAKLWRILSSIFAVCAFSAGVIFFFTIFWNGMCLQYWNIAPELAREAKVSGVVMLVLTILTLGTDVAVRDLTKSRWQNPKKPSLAESRTRIITVLLFSAMALLILVNAILTKNFASAMFYAGGGIFILGLACVAIDLSGRTR